LSITLSLDIYGAIACAQISTPYVDASRLTDLPFESGHRTFGAFYQLLRGATPQEQSFLSLLKPQQYEYLTKSGTLDLPHGLSIDDAASADDFREALRACGIKGNNLRGVYQTLAACLLLGNLKYTPLEGISNVDILEDACTLLDIDPDFLAQHIPTSKSRDAFVQDVYRLLVEWVVSFINSQLTISREKSTGAEIRIVEIPSPSGGQQGYGAFVRGWAAESLEFQVLQEAFDDTRGLNAEMAGDGINLLKVSADNNSGTFKLNAFLILDCVELLNKVALATESLSSYEVLTEKLSDQMFSPCYKTESLNNFAIRHTFNLGEWLQYDANAGFSLTRTLSSIRSAVQIDSFFYNILSVLPSLERSLTPSKIDTLCQSLQNARIWSVMNLKPTHTQGFDPSQWDVSLVSAQVRTFHLAQHHARKKMADYTADFSLAEFYDRYSSIFPSTLDIRNVPARDSILMFLEGRKLPAGEWYVGNERVWIGELGWENLEGELDDCIAGVRGSEELLNTTGPYTPGMGTPLTPLNDGGSGYGFYAGGRGIAESQEGLLNQADPRYPRQIASDDKSYYYSMDDKDRLKYGDDIEGAQNVEVVKTSTLRTMWLILVWLVTWPFPPFLLSWVGRMKRRDVQIAWREKVTICFLIFLLCGTVVFYIIFFQRLICPEFDKVNFN
jgi:chitin synthase